MRLLPFVGAAAGFAAGALLWAAAAVTELGSVAGESSDPAHRARVTTDVPGWVQAAKPLGLALMATSALVAGVLLWKRRRSS